MERHTILRIAGKDNACLGKSGIGRKINPDTGNEVAVPLSFESFIHLGERATRTVGSLLILLFPSSSAQNLFIKTKTNAVGWSAENKAINAS